MDIEEAIVRVQCAYPRIYLACHSRHQNSRTTTAKLSQRDGTLLAHLTERTAVPQHELARHIGISKSTMSEALQELESCGYITRERGDDDRRGVMVRRTAMGTQAMSGGSVLETARLRRLLDRLPEAERERAIEGLETLARAAIQEGADNGEQED